MDAGTWIIVGCVIYLLLWNGIYREKFKAWLVDHVHYEFMQELNPELYHRYKCVLRWGGFFIVLCFVAYFYMFLYIIRLIFL